MAQECKTLSLDTSSSKSGWAYYVNGNYKESGVINLDTNECKKKYKGNSDQRVKDMCLLLFELFDKYKPDIRTV